MPTSRRSLPLLALPLLALPLLALVLLGGCGEKTATPDAAPRPDQRLEARVASEAGAREAGPREAGPREASPADAGAPGVLLKTSLGEITVELDPQHAPITVANLYKYVDAKFYDGTLIHRVAPGFVIQGGGYEATTFKEKATLPPIKNEADNGLPNLRGTIAMAREDAADTATSQFFINLVDNPNLNHSATKIGYAVFGKVVKGLEVVDAIAKVPTGARGPFSEECPLTDVVILSATRLP